MRTAGMLFICVALLCIALPAMAGDIVDMPTANTVKARNAELNFIYWDFDEPETQAGQVGPASAGPPSNAMIYEAFLGITDRIELDVDVLDLDNVDTYTEVNLYLTAIPEKPMRPSLVIGATNLFGSDWTPGNDEISAFACTAYNFNLPASGKPSFNDPVMRLHLGWGDAYHEGWFGGLQMMFAPWLGAAALSYQGDPSYMGTLILGKHVELTYGYKAGDPFYRGGLFFNW